MKQNQRNNAVARLLRRRGAKPLLWLHRTAVLMVATSLATTGYASRAQLSVPEQPSANDTIVWGLETNKLQAGLHYEGPPGRSFFGLETKFVAGVRSLWEKEMDFFWLPPERERYRVSLMDDRGRPVQRTAKGLSLGQPISKHPILERKGGEYEAWWFPPSSPPHFFDSFKLSDFFVVPKPGKYKFQWEMRLLHHNSATNFQTIVLPPVILDIVVGQATPLNK
jgi:hypothetical protein